MSDGVISFIHECAHGITPQRERKVKHEYIRIDHSRQFYENFSELLSFAYERKYISYRFTNIEERNDLKLYDLVRP